MVTKGLHLVSMAASASAIFSSVPVYVEMTSPYHSEKLHSVWSMVHSLGDKNHRSSALWRGVKWHQWWMVVAYDTNKLVRASRLALSVITRLWITTYDKQLSGYRRVCLTMIYGLTHVAYQLWNELSTHRCTWVIVVAIRLYGRFSHLLELWLCRWRTTIYVFFWDLSVKRRISCPHSS